MKKADKKTQVFQALYGEDSPTLLLKPEDRQRLAKEKTIAEAAPLPKKPEQKQRSAKESSSKALPSLLKLEDKQALIKETATAEASPLRDRIERALERKPKVNIRDTSSMPAVQTGSDKLFYGQVQRGQQAVPVNPVQDAPVGPFNLQYVLQRLNQGIMDAQDACNYEEAIRLQELCYQLQDETISPIQAAREAWLRPLVTTKTDKTVTSPKAKI